jgi:GNAT superfamily N-acetyltransferase
VIYRLATEEDMLRLAEMRWEFRAEEDADPPVVSREEFVQECAGFMRQGLWEGDWAYWVAESGGEMVSHVCVRLVRAVPKPSRLEDAWGYDVTNVYTRPEHRDRGVGSALLGRVVAWAREEELNTLIVWPGERSAAFYERVGFTGRNDVMELEIRGD